jgi:hypothetical protein
LGQSQTGRVIIHFYVARPVVGYWSRGSLIDLPLSPNNFYHPTRKMAIQPCHNRTGGSYMTNPLPTPDARAHANRRNALLSTGPRTGPGKQRSSQNALRHGLTAACAVLPSEDRAAHDAHCRGFFDEYQPATPTETQLTQELADTAWRLNRIPSLEAALLDRAANPPTDQARIDFDIVDAHRALATLGLHYTRLSRQFKKSLDTLREIQADRAERERRDLKDAAALLELHKHKGVPWEPSDHGFVSLKCDVERFAERTMRLNEARHIERVRFYIPPPTGN